jgi:hypothetical protein
VVHLFMAFAVEVRTLVAELREPGWHILLALAAAQAEDLARRGELRGIVPGQGRLHAHRVVTHARSVNSKTTRLIR